MLNLISFKCSNSAILILMFIIIIIFI